MDGLPEGFEIDQPAQSAGGLPPGFQIDQQPSVGQDIEKTLPAAGARGLIHGVGFAGDMASLLGKGTDYLDRMMGLEPPPSVDIGTSAQLQRGVEKATGPLYEPKTTAGRYVGSATEAVTNPMSYLGPGSLAAKAGLAGLSGVGAQAGEDVAGTPGSIVGGLAGAAAPSLLTSTGRAASAIPSSRQASVDVLNQAGVFPRAGDVLGSNFIKGAESTLGALPGAFNAAKKSEEKIGRQFTSAVLKKGIGEDADLATPEVINRARDRIGDKLEDVAKKLPITHDKKFGNDLVGISQDMMREGLPEQTVNRIQAQIDNTLYGFVTQRNGKSIMDGATYQALTRKDTPLARAIDDSDPNVSYYATRLRSALDDAMERSATGRGTREGVGRRQALADLKEARRQWFNHIVIGRAAAGAGEQAPEGIITPARLRQMLTGGSQDRQLLYARGKGAGLQDLARAGNHIMTPLPNSKTAERWQTIAGPAAVLSTFTGHPLAIPAYVAPGLTGKALLSKPVQNYLINRSPGEFSARMRNAAMPAARSLVTNPYVVGAPNPYSP